MNRQSLDIDERLNRVANNLECQAAELIPELLAVKWPCAASRIMHDFSELIQELRNRADQYAENKKA